MICPTCGKILEEVKYSPGYTLSRGQWESIKCGDYYCDRCRQYFWVKLVPSPKQSTHSLRPIEVHHEDASLGVITVGPTAEDFAQNEKNQREYRRAGLDNLGSQGSDQG